MTTKDEQVLGALKSLTQAGFPAADVWRDREKPARVPPGGLFIINRGDPGEPERDFSPPRWNYQHEIEVVIVAPPGADLDAILFTFDGLLSADRTLGGLTHWLEAEGLDREPAQKPGTETHDTATVTVLAEYSAESPLRA